MTITIYIYNYNDNNNDDDNDNDNGNVNDNDEKGKEKMTKIKREPLQEIMLFLLIFFSRPSITSLPSWNFL